MKTRTDSRRTASTELPHDTHAEEILVFVYNDEEEDEAPCSEYVVMSQESEMLALEEYLRERGARTIH